MKSTTVKAYSPLGSVLPEEERMVRDAHLHNTTWVAKAYSETGRVLTEAEIKERDAKIEGLRDPFYVRPKPSLWYRLKLWYRREVDSFRRIWESK